MSNGVRVEMNEPPWVPAGTMNSGGMYDALNAAAEAVIAQIGGDNEWTWETTSAAGGWPSEATVLIGIHNVDLAAEFGDAGQPGAHRIAEVIDGLDNGKH